MSFRHTFVTRFLYKFDQEEWLKEAEAILSKYSGNVEWRDCGSNSQYGYFHGVIKDLDGQETLLKEKEILEELEKAGIRIKIVYE